jgi:endonuclease/exonuclease/phosphatase family metal-dependent hydrolase
MSTPNYLDDPGFQTTLTDLQDHLRAYPTLQALNSSVWFSQNRTRVESILNHPHVESQFSSVSSERDWLRCISWNIEKGKELDSLLEIFSSDQRFLTADLILLQEADFGMARSGNRFVARELACALGMNFAFAPCFVELTKGVGEDLKAAGENSSGLQGNAILSRFPIRSARTIRLTQCFEPFEFTEKRFGNRNAVVCEVTVGDRALTAATTHLEVRNSPRCRARQTAALLETLGNRGDTFTLIGGDFNSNTFARGTAWRTFRSLSRLVGMKSDDLLASTLSPQSREPLFDVLYSKGYEWEPFNDGTSTSATFLRSLEDAHLIPRFLRDRALRTLRSYDGGLPLRLDWFVGKNVSPAVRPTEKEDLSGAGGPLPPGTITEFEKGIKPESLSDHRPILVDLLWRP